MLWAEEAISFEATERLWRDASGTYELTATLQLYRDRTATLKTEDGKTLEIAIDKLSKSDRIYLARQLQIARKKDTVEQKPQPVQIAAEQPAQRVKEKQVVPELANVRAEQLYGVDWYPNDSAKQLAAAEEKPILWFRVLGDLSGFM
jgi:hypothetical protein